MADDTTEADKKAEADKEASPEMQKYFKNINEDVKNLYKIAEEARSKGYDPVDNVEISLARNMAERVEGLISVAAPQLKDSGIVPRMQELETEYGTLNWRVGLQIALEVAKQKFCKFETEIEAMEVGIRVGFAYVTVGVVASPLEGFVKLELKDRKDGKKYFSLKYSGPVRSAGGTGGSVSVLIADYVRKKMGYHPYDPTEDEILRTITELDDYHERITNLQYRPSKEEVRFLIQNLPVQIDGDGSEKFEVSNFKDQPRIETNIIRNGIALVVAECLCQKAPKVFKQIKLWGKEFDMDQWMFLEKFLEIQKKSKAKDSSGEKEENKEDQPKVKPDFTFIKDLVAGRPVLTHPLAVGGFRLRYGRGRNSGFSANCISPATMVMTDGFAAIGTQLKMERPGKATSLAVCDQIEGPIVKLKDGSVRFIDTEEEARKYRKDTQEILFLGDMLINYGDFFNRAHPLIPAGYNEDWYERELEKAGWKGDLKEIGIEQSIELSKKYGVPLHPRYTYHWADINKKQFLSLIEWLKSAAIEKDRLVIPLEYDHEKDIEDIDPKRVLEILGVPHKLVSEEHVVIEKDHALGFKTNLGVDDNIEPLLDKVSRSTDENVLCIVNSLASMPIRDKSGTYIGARMGRPEKAKMRKLTGSPHGLFPIGNEGGRMRSFQSALEKEVVTAEFPIYQCTNCENKTIFPKCEICDAKTHRIRYCSKCKTEMETEDCPDCKTTNEKDEEVPIKTIAYRRQKISINHHFQKATQRLKLPHFPELIKGIRGTSSRDHTPEHIIKGILRAVHNIHVNKEGTVRYDMTEVVLTAFKPKEVGTSIERLKELGYLKDIHGKPLENEEQILELKVQDVVLPACPEGEFEGADAILFRVCNFLDDLLDKLYGLPRFYNLKDKSELPGQLALALSPHTSAGTVARIIGFSKTQGFMAHPLLHSLMRRDCDGDEACVMMLLDGLVNFSRAYLPSHRGAIQDAPLVLSAKIIPSEVDDMVFDMEMVDQYPLELYEAGLNYTNPWDIKIELLNDNLGTPKQYEGYGFTHDTTNINSGVRYSQYKIIPTMQEKVQAQTGIAEKIRAVKEDDVARLVIERHFIRDIKGNLRKFSMQQFRCIECNEKFRRPPLAGKCTKCNGKIIFTIHEGSVVKYLQPSIQLAEKYSLPAYLKQTLQITKNRIESIFGKEKEKQEGLVKWFGK